MCSRFGEDSKFVDSIELFEKISKFNQESLDFLLENPIALPSRPRSEQYIVTQVLADEVLAVDDAHEIHLFILETQPVLDILYKFCSRSTDLDAPARAVLTTLRDQRISLCCFGVANV